MAASAAIVARDVMPNTRPMTACFAARVGAAAISRLADAAAADATAADWAIDDCVIVGFANDD